MKLKGRLTFFSSTWRLPHFHRIITTYIFLANVAKTELGVLSKLFISGSESGHSCARTFCDWKIMNPLYNAAAKHFKLTSLFRFNISFYIIYPQLFSTAINHINHLQEVLASELISKLSKIKHNAFLHFY